ncbi:hypothetical protein HYPSUDRAFT_54628 [Hypholoma sublateritium FD-334 SS-4]|uniref:peptidylprolyl isomerase n=1 Tax=Hypholoma sublateritium (strain FD-334 SS-4) TaxID=945553 RepID=A0A0D2NVZ5_HYPSF|nr:hypothetical protein HYPSUDRAFT_54628 [Hypholoma sublateritium FD-334 SS-4]
MANWSHISNRTSSAAEVFPLFQSTSLSIKMCYEPLPNESMPQNQFVQKVKKVHGIVKDEWSRGKLVVVQGDQVLYAGGIHSESPLVTVDLSAITLRVETFANRLLNRFYFAFTGSAKVDDPYGAGATAEFYVSFDTEAAFWAFASLLTSENHAQNHSFFQHSGMRYCDEPAAIAPLITGTGTQGWTREQALLGGLCHFEKESVHWAPEMSEAGARADGRRTKRTRLCDAPPQNPSCIHAFVSTVVICALRNTCSALLATRAQPDQGQTVEVSPHRSPTMAQTVSHFPARNWHIRLSPGLHLITLDTSICLTSALRLDDVRQRNDHGFTLFLHYADQLHSEVNDSEDQSSNLPDRSLTPRLYKEALGTFLPAGTVFWKESKVTYWSLQAMSLSESISTICPELQVQESQDDKGSKVIISDVLTGTGNAVERGHKVSVWYSSKIEGTNVVFDQADATNSEPALLDIGSGENIQGWEEGMIGMRPGGRRVITIPASKAYGHDGLGSLVPPDATVQIVRGGGWMIRKRRYSGPGRAVVHRGHIMGGGKTTNRSLAWSARGAAANRQAAAHGAEEKGGVVTKGDDDARFLSPWMPSM